MNEAVFNGNVIEQLKEKYAPVTVEEVEESAFQYDLDGPRLIISKIENENFKSYAGIRTLGPFHKNFTCIIGPNGSGKSNVIDSLLFVFGFRASKIRSKKLSVLIHKSELFPNVNSCTVKVFFQTIKPHAEDDEKYDIIPDSEFVVSRTAFNDNSSVVKINEKRLSNKEACEFLKKKGIDLDHNRFLILQGEVEQIALMKPKAITEHEDGLLEYLEDIIGSNRYKQPLDQLNKNLEELCELRAERLNRVKVAESEKKELEDVRNEAVKYLKICNEILVRKNILFQIKLQENRQLLSSAEERHKDAKNELEETEEQIKKINKLKATKLEELKQTEHDLKIKTAEYNKCHDEFNRLEIEDTRLRDSRKHCKSSIDKLVESIKKHKSDIEAYEHVPGESQDRIKELTKEKENLDVMKKKESSLLTEAKKMLGEETKDLQIEKENHSKQVINEEGKLYKQETELSNMKCEIDLLLNNYTKEKNNFNRLQEQIKEISEKITEGNEIVKHLSVELPTTKSEFSKIQNDLEQNKSKSMNLINEIHQLKDQLRDKSVEEISNKTLKFLYDQQNTGKLSGVVGRLGDLAYVDQKYDIPVSTACDRLDSIVCDMIDQAQKCVELMKVYKINRAAFIALDKVSRFSELARRPFQAPENSKRLFDLLHFDEPRYSGVFYFATRDTLVVDSVNFAKHINKTNQKRYRMVTLKGELFETTGAMTGGGRSVVKGRIRTDCSRKSIPSAKQGNERSNNEQLLKQKEGELSELNSIISKLNLKYDELNRKVQENERTLHYHKGTLGSLTKDEKDLKEKMKESNERVIKLKPDQKKIDQMKKLITSTEEKYDKDSKKLKEMKGKVEEVEQEIERRGCAKLGCIESRLNTINTKLVEKEKTLKKIEKIVMQAQRIVRESNEKLEKDNLSKESAQKELINIDKQLELMVGTGKETLAAYHKTNKEVKDLHKVKEALEKELSEFDEDMKNQSQVKNQQTRRVREAGEELHKFKYQLKQVQDNIKSLKLYTIPEDCKEDVVNFMDLLGVNEEALSSQTMHSGNRLKTYTVDELEQLKLQGVSYQNLESEIQRQKPHLSAIDEYRQKEELYMQKAAELNVVTEIRNEQKQELDRLKKQRLKEFTVGFNLITGKLKEMYRMITMGGDAELELVDTLDPFSEGVVFSVRPPKKSWKNISNLSGGEKTLSSLALVFALHHFKPTPFYVMDEIDAALDFKNVSIVANYIKDRTKNAQFIIISLRNNMYELADRLVGIYKPFGFSKTTMINPSKLASLLRNNQKLQEKEKLTQPISSQPLIQE